MADKTTKLVALVPVLIGSGRVEIGEPFDADDELRDRCLSRGLAESEASWKARTSEREKAEAAVRKAAQAEADKRREAVAKARAAKGKGDGKADE